MKMMQIFIRNMKLKTILNEVTSTSKLEYFFKECMQKYFPEYYSDIQEWGIPKFSITSMPTKAGLFVYQPRTGHIVNPVLKINKDFVDDDKFLRPVVFHETIHYVQANIVARRIKPYLDGKWRVVHDAYFIEKMNKINAVEGNDYVTPTHNVSTHGQPPSKDTIHIYGYFHGSRPVYMWTVKPSEKLEKYMSTKDKPFYFSTNDSWFKTPPQQFRDSAKTLKLGIVDDPDKIVLVNKNLK